MWRKKNTVVNTATNISSPKFVPLRCANSGRVEQPTLFSIMLIAKEEERRKEIGNKMKYYISFKL